MRAACISTRGLRVAHAFKHIVSGHVLFQVTSCFRSRLPASLINGPTVARRQSECESDRVCRRGLGARRLGAECNRPWIAVSLSEVLFMVLTTNAKSRHRSCLASSGVSARNRRLSGATASGRTVEPLRSRVPGHGRGRSSIRRRAAGARVYEIDRLTDLARIVRSSRPVGRDQFHCRAPRQIQLLRSAEAPTVANRIGDNEALEISPDRDTTAPQRDVAGPCASLSTAPLAPARTPAGNRGFST